MRLPHPWWVPRTRDEWLLAAFGATIAIWWIALLLSLALN